MNNSHPLNFNSNGATKSLSHLDGNVDPSKSNPYLLQERGGNSPNILILTLENLL